MIERRSFLEEARQNLATKKQREETQRQIDKDAVELYGEFNQLLEHGERRKRFVHRLFALPSYAFQRLFGEKGTLSQLGDERRLSRVLDGTGESIEVTVKASSASPRARWISIDIQGIPEKRFCLFPWGGRKVPQYYDPDSWRVRQALSLEEVAGLRGLLGDLREEVMRS